MKTEHDIKNCMTDGVPDEHLMRMSIEEAMFKTCQNCRHCEQWNEYQGLYCSNEEGEKYLCDVAGDETCKKWEDRR